MSYGQVSSFFFTAVKYKSDNKIPLELTTNTVLTNFHRVVRLRTDATSNITITLPKKADVPELKEYVFYNDNLTFSINIKDTEDSNSIKNAVSNTYGNTTDVPPLTNIELTLDKASKKWKQYSGT